MKQQWRDIFISTSRLFSHEADARDRSHAVTQYFYMRADWEPEGIYTSGAPFNSFNFDLPAVCQSKALDAFFM